jgi:diguanylate cyclase
MNELGVLVAVVIVLVLGGAGGFWGLRSARLRGRTNAGSVDRADTLTAREREAALDLVKSAVHDLLHGVSGQLDTMQGDTSRYGRALQEHRDSLERTATIEDLRELEGRLLDQVKGVQGANDRYRRELDAANVTVAEQRKDLEQLHRAAGVDFLTELPNRRQLEERMREEMGRAKRYGQGFSVIVLDIDHFKRINDEHGHVAGDRVLRAIARRLFDEKRASDFLARYGGEEFVMLLPETPLENAVRLAEKICENIRGTQFRFQNQPVQITLSAGVGEVTPGADTAESLFERVDAALYRAKREGRNKVCASDAPAAAS